MKNKILDFFVRVLSVEERITFLLRLKNQHAAKRRFLTFLQIDYYLNQRAAQQKTAMAFKKLERKINTFEKIRRQKQWRYFRIAAVLVIGLLIAGIQFNSKKIKSLPQLDTQSVVKIGTDKAVLTLEDGQQIPLEKGHQYQSANAQSNGTEIVYESEVTNQPIQYNTLTIPRGGQFALTLSDGTKVWLNSDTRLKYPVRFGMKAPREVELLYGEAYFEVRPSSDTNGSPFRVIGQEQTIEVLGTAFNIQNYQNEPLTTTTLVEGKIKITTPDGAVQLAPQQQLVRMQKKAAPVGFSPGLVSYNGFDDSPDAEVISYGPNIKVVDDVSIGRHGNYLQWGYKASPKYMTQAAQLAFVNSIHYIAKFSGSKPYVFRKESSRVNAPTLAYVVSDKGFAYRQKQAQRVNDKIDAVKAKEMAGMALTENEKANYKNLKNTAPTRIDALKRLPKDLVQKFANQWNSYLNYYEENIGYIKPAKRAYHFEFDRDVQELGIANNDPKLLDVCVEKLLKKQDVTRAQRILERYTTQKFEHPKDWKKWLDKNRDRLFFSATGGYKFRIKQ